MIKCPEVFPEIKEWLRRVAFTVNRIVDIVNSAGQFTLTANTTTTTVTNVFAGDETKVFTFPTTLNAANETMYITTKSDGSFVVTHSNSATTDRTFDYFLLG